MITERHYDDETLIALAEGDPAAPTRDPHLQSCRPCAETFEALRTLPSTLHEEAVWDRTPLSEEPKRETVEWLRGKQLLALPPEARRPFLAAHPHFRTPAIVQMLIDASDKAITRMPPEALEYGKLAVEIAEELGDPMLHASALREWGYSLYYTGNFREALQSTERARALIANSGNEVRDLGRIELQEALILSALGDHQAAHHKACAASDIFEALHDGERVVVALRVQAIAANRLRQHNLALRLLQTANDRCVDPVARAGLLQNIAVTYRELGDVESAMHYFVQALQAAQKIGSAPYIAKARWHLGRLLLSQGRCNEALEVFTSVREGFVEMQMHQDVALVTIDAAQACLAVGDTDSVVESCRTALKYFIDAGLSQSEGCLTAVALIREAAAEGRLSDHILRYARRRADRRPRLQFAFALD